MSRLPKTTHILGEKKTQKKNPKKPHTHTHTETLLVCSRKNANKKAYVKIKDQNIDFIKFQNWCLDLENHTHTYTQICTALAVQQSHKNLWSRLMRTDRKTWLQPKILPKEWASVLVLYCLWLRHPRKIWAIFETAVSLVETANVWKNHHHRHRQVFATEMFLHYQVQDKVKPRDLQTTDTVTKPPLYFCINWSWVVDKQVDKYMQSHIIDNYQESWTETVCKTPPPSHNKLQCQGALIINYSAMGLP